MSDKMKSAKPWYRRLKMPPRKYPVAWWSMICAFVLAPILVALLGFWIFLIPVVALPLGAVPYLIFGGSLIYLFSGRIRPGFLSFAFLGIVAFLIMLAVIIAVEGTGISVFIADHFNVMINESMINLYALLGPWHATLWMGFVAVIYNWLERKNAN